MAIERKQYDALPDTNLFCASGNGGCGDHGRGAIRIVHEVMFGQPDLMQSQLIRPRNLFQGFGVDLLGGNAKLWRRLETVEYRIFHENSFLARKAWCWPLL